MQILANDDPRKAQVLGRLEQVRAAIEREPAGASTAQALIQCERLQVSILQFHAEGLRFAAFTLLKMTLPPSAAFGDAVQHAAQELKVALDAAGYSH